MEPHQQCREVYPEGQVAVRIRYDEGDMLHFEVEDSGIGIPQEEQDKIFAMYYQVKDSHGGKPATGTGIGPAVSKRLAKSMGGISPLPASRVKAPPLRLPSMRLP